MDFSPRFPRNYSFRRATIDQPSLRIANFIGTYWPVQDDAAELFAKTFYAKILNGFSVGVALQQSRTLLQQSELIDWADYVHYGDYTFEVKINK